MFAPNLKSLRRVLCLGCHADDIEIGCGGSVLRLLDEHPGLEVWWVVLSGEPTRAEEARRSATPGWRAPGSGRSSAVTSATDIFLPNGHRLRTSSTASPRESSLTSYSLTAATMPIRITAFSESSRGTPSEIISSGSTRFRNTKATWVSPTCSLRSTRQSVGGRLSCFGTHFRRKWASPGSRLTRFGPCYGCAVWNATHPRALPKDSTPVKCCSKFDQRRGRRPHHITPHTIRQKRNACDSPGDL